MYPVKYVIITNIYNGQYNPYLIVQKSIFPY